MANDRELPAITKWAIENQDELTKESLWRQVKLVRDQIARLLAKTHEEYLGIEASIQVIGTHTSTRVKLPVYQIILPNGTKFTLRCNFYDWKVSVQSPVAVEADFMNLFDPTERILSVHCEGFPKDLVFGPLAQNQYEFTLAVNNDYDLYTFFWIYSRKVLGIGT